MRFFGHPPLLRFLYRKAIFEIKNDEGHVFLTFDDGPTEEVTDWVLNLLDLHDQKATFFCIGKNVKENPLLFSKILSNGHAVGNHTENHFRPFKLSTSELTSEVDLASKSIASSYFRPPYGQMKPFQYLNLIKKFKVVFWSVLSYDFDQDIDIQEALENLKNKTKAGSVIVFHDSKKAFYNLKKLLPEYLEWLKENDLVSKTLPL